MTKIEQAPPTPPEYSNYREFLIAMRAEGWSIEEIVVKWEALDKDAKAKRQAAKTNIILGKGVIGSTGPINNDGSGKSAKDR